LEAGVFIIVLCSLLGGYDLKRANTRLLDFGRTPGGRGVRIVAKLLKGESLARMGPVALHVKLWHSMDAIAAMCGQLDGEPRSGEPP